VTKLTEPEQKELKELGQEQQELADLLEKLITPDQPEGDKK